MSVTIKTAVVAALSACLTLAFVGQPGLAVSTNQKIPAEAWRKNKPVLPAPRPLQLPAPEVYKLANGLTVELLEDHRVPFVTVQMGIKCGASYEPQEQSGLANITAGMLSEGAGGKTSKQIAEEVDFLGGALGATADADFTMLSGSALSRYTDRLFAVLTDVILHPSFPEDELKLQKTNLIQELVMKRSKPEFLAEERFHKVVFGEHPYAVVAPTAESINRIARPDLERFHKEHYLPNQAVLVVVGDFQSDAVKKLIEKLFAEWQAGQLAKVESAAVPEQHGRKIYLVDRPGSVQSSIKLGNCAIAKNDPDYFPAIVTNQVLGGAAVSRLFQNIRENKGYTYGAYSRFSPRKQPGAFQAGAEVRTEVTGASLQEFLYELDKIRNLVPTDKELETAKNYLSGSFQLGLETQSGLAQRLMEQQLYELPADYLANYTKNVMAVTPDQVRKIARKHIDLGNIVVTVVGDAKKVKPDLDCFGPVEVYDASGKLVQEQSKSPGS